MTLNTKNINLAHDLLYKNGRVFKVFLSALDTLTELKSQNWKALQRLVISEMGETIDKRHIFPKHRSLR